MQVLYRIAIVSTLLMLSLFFVPEIRAARLGTSNLNLYAMICQPGAARNCSSAATTAAYCEKTCDSCDCINPPTSACDTYDQSGTAIQNCCAVGDCSLNEYCTFNENDNPSCTVACDVRTDVKCCEVEGQYQWRVHFSTNAFSPIESGPTGYAHSVNWDVNASTCSDLCLNKDASEIGWNLGGDDCDPNTPGIQVSCCCGDDSGSGRNEYVRTCSDNEGGAFCNTLSGPAKVACCNDNTKCVYNDLCYSLGAVQQGRNCTRIGANWGVWADEIGPTVTITGAPAAWQKTPVPANVQCLDLASGCHDSSRALKVYTSNPAQCPNSIGAYDIPSVMLPYMILQHAWVCAAALDNIGNFGNTTPVEFRVDPIRPNTSFVSPPEHAWKTSNFDVVFLDLDPDSGVATCHYRVWDDTTVTKDWTARLCSGIVTITVGIPGSGALCTTEGLDKCRVDAYAVDIAGNGDVTVFNTTHFSIATTPPRCEIEDVAEGTNPTDKPECQHNESETIYYNNQGPLCSSGVGKFSVLVDSTHISGVDHVTFPLTVSAGGNEPGPGPIYAHNYQWDSGDISNYLATATCFSVAGLTAQTNFRVLRDITPPEGGSIDYPDGYWNKTVLGIPAIEVNFREITDSGAGVNFSSDKLLRRHATLDKGTCGGFTAWYDEAINPGSPYPDPVSNGMCYMYTYKVSDNVLNEQIYASINVTKVDTDPPDNPNSTDTGEYTDDPRLRFTAKFPPLPYVPDAEGELNKCYIEIASDSGFTSIEKVDEIVMGLVGINIQGTYTWNGGEDAKTYYARVRCDDKAGNINWTYGEASDGITVDTSIPQIPVVNDVRGPGQTDDVDTITSTEVAWVYWRAVDTGSPIVREEYSLYEYSQDGSPVSLTGWIQSVPSGATAMGGGYATMDMRTNTGEVNLTKLHQANPLIPEQMSNGKHYFFKVNVTDSVGHWNVSTSDGFMVTACEGQPCGKTCELNNQQGACNGLGVCYIGGGCGLSCSLPAGWRACYDNDNNKLPDCNPLRDNPSAYCKRTGATRCGAGSLCLDSVANGRCLDPFAGSGGPVDMTGSWTTYQVSDPTKFYGPNNPITVQAGGIGGVPSSFEPLLECTLEATLPGKYYYLDRWGKMDALLSFRDFPLNSDGEWNLTKCALKTDYDDNKGWDMKNDSTIYHFKIDTTKPAASIKGPTGKIGIRFNITWEGIDPIVNGMKSDVDYYYVEYVDRSEFVGNNWQGDETTKIRANYSEVVLPSSKADVPAVYCFRVKAVDNAGNAGDWSCEPLGSGTPEQRFAGCNCAALDTRPPGGIWVSTAPKFSNAPETSVTADWGAAPSGGSGSAMAASGFRTMVVPEGTQCFEVDYRVTDNTGKNLTPGNGWVQWGAINDRHNVPIWESGSYRTIDCTTQSHVVFSPMSVIGADAENRAYFFRVRAVSDISGYAPVSPWNETTEGAMIDRTKPDVDLSAIRRLDGSPIPEGDTILTRESVIINVTGDPWGVDFTGANSSWIVWKKISTSGYSDEGRYYCPAGSATCTTRDPWNVLDGDYNVSYQGFSMDRAGNVGRSTVDSFNARAPLGLVTSIRELYLVLGSFEHATIQVSNRQNVNEDISLMLQGDYKYSKFLDVTGGELSLDKRTLNITLLPLETKTATVVVYTGDICEACEMNVTTESRIHDDINSTLRMRINVIFPAEFSGLSTAGLVLLMALAALAYMRFGARKQE